MSQLVRVILYPSLLFISIPLVIFAVVTTIAASSTLFFRVLLVYADLAFVLIKNQFLHHHHTSKSPSSPSPAGRRARKSPQHGRRRRSSTSSGDPLTFGGSRTPRSTESSSGLGIYSVGNMQRDFEGVGGWRIPNTESEDSLWTSMNTRLELPASFVEGRHRHHRRSITSGGPSSSSFRPSWPSEQPQRRTSMSAQALGTTSPEEYFVARHSSKSTTALGTAGFGKIRQ